MIKKLNDLIIPFYLIFCAIIFVFQIYNVGFITADDAFNILKDPNDFLKVFQLSHQVMRLNLYLGSLLNYILYFKNNYTYYRVIQILSILSEIIIFCAFLHELYKSKELTFLGCILILLFNQHGWQHHSLNSFPFNLHLAFTLLLTSFYLLLKKFLASWIHFFAGLLLSLSCLVYEMFMPYVFIYFLLYDIKKREDKSYQYRYEDLKRGVYFFIPYLLTATCQIIDKLNKSFNYDGTNLQQGISFINTLKVLKVYTIFCPPSQIL